MIIRDACNADVAGIAEIYNHAVRYTTAVWNETVVDVANRQRWLKDKQSAGYPVLVAVDRDVVLGYATYGQFRPFDGYRHTVEDSIYVHPASQGRGVGSALLGELIARADRDGMHVMVAAIEARNTASIGLHSRHGFTHVGRLPEVGFKHDSWLDLIVMQRMINQDKTGTRV